MAIQEHRRENLLRDATAYQFRILFGARDSMTAKAAPTNASLGTPANGDSLSSLQRGTDSNSLPKELFVGFRLHPAAGAPSTVHSSDTTNSTSTRSSTPDEPQSSNALGVGVEKIAGWSIYFDEDPVLQFSADAFAATTNTGDASMRPPGTNDQMLQWRLRRLYLNGKRYRTNNGRLVLLHRPQRGGQVRLQEEFLSPQTQTRIVDECFGKLVQTAKAIYCEQMLVLGCHPGASREVRELVLSVLDQIQNAGELLIANTPNAV